MKPILHVLWLAAAACLVACSSDSTNPTEASAIVPTYIQLDTRTGLVASVVAPALNGDTITFVSLNGTRTYLQITEMSRAQWLASGRTATWPGDTLPATTAATWLSRTDAESFATEFTTRTGFSLRLPKIVELTPFLPAVSTRALALDQAVLFDNTQGKPATPTAKAAIEGVYGILGGVREHTWDGGTFGGSYLDNFYAIPPNYLYDTVSDDTRHPANGMRLVLVWK